MEPNRDAPGESEQEFLLKDLDPEGIADLVASDALLSIRDRVHVLQQVASMLLPYSKLRVSMTREGKSMRETNLWLWARDLARFARDGEWPSGGITLMGAFRLLLLAWVGDDNNYALADFGEGVVHPGVWLMFACSRARITLLGLDTAPHSVRPSLLRELASLTEGQWADAEVPSGPPEQLRLAQVRWLVEHNVPGIPALLAVRS